MIFIAALMISVSLIFGSRSRNMALGQKMYTCSRCRRPSYHTIVRLRRWFTLYFIPIIPMSQSTVSVCNLCGYRELISNEQADSWFSPDQTGGAAAPQKTPEQLMDEGTTHSKAGRYMEAIAAYDQVIQLVPGHPLAYFSKGNSLTSLGRYQEAIMAYDRAIQLAPNVPDAYYAKGKALESLGRAPEAQQAYEIARQLGYRG